MTALAEPPPLAVGLIGNVPPGLKLRVNATCAGKLMIWLALLMVIASAALPMPPSLLTVIIALEMPVTSGVPEIRPFAVLTVTPVGKPLGRNP